MAKAVVWNDVSLLTLGMKNLGNQINAAFPFRDGASDGAVGDYKHQQGKSGHNPDDTSHDNAEWDGDSDNTPEVRAIDVDSDFGEGVSAQTVVDHIRKLPNVSSVLRYIIYNKKIYRASNNFEPEDYTGASPHTEHVHFSGAYSNASDSNKTFNYRLGDIPVALTTADKTWITAQVTAAANAAAAKVIADLAAREDDYLNVKINDVANPNRTDGDIKRDFAKLRGVLVGDVKDTANAKLDPASPLARVIKAADKILAE